MGCSHRGNEYQSTKLSQPTARNTSDYFLSELRAKRQSQFKEQHNAHINHKRLEYVLPTGFIRESYIEKELKIHTVCK